MSSGRVSYRAIAADPDDVAILEWPQGIHPLRYVVVHNGLLDDAERLKWRELRALPWIEYVGRFGSGDLYRPSGAVEGVRIEKIFSWDYARGHKDRRGRRRAPLDRGSRGRPGPP
jgi:hypothetical protein